MDAQDSTTSTETAKVWRNGHKKVLDALASGLSYSKAAKAAGVERTTIWIWRRRDPAFAQACDAARTEARVVVCASAIDYLARAFDEEADVTGPGVTAATKALAAYERDVWGDKVQHSGDPEHPIEQRFVIEYVNGDGPKNPTA